MLRVAEEGAKSSYSESLSSFILLILLLITYGFCYFFVKKLPKGILRIISLLGVFYILFLVPWYFPSSIFLRGLASLFISWISSFKLILFAFGKGDLILCDNYVNFVVVAAFPFKIIHESNKENPIKTRSEKVQMYTILTSTGSLFSENLVQVLALAISMSYLASSYIILFLTLMIVVHLAKVMMPQLEVIPILKQPYRATSLQNFWGRRWNQVASDILRHTIYDPTRRILEASVGVGPGKLVALVITLVVSGIMHEMMFYHMTCGMKPTWEMTKFFVLQGVCMALEIAIKRFWVRSLGWSPIHPIVSVPLTLIFVLTSSYWLIFLPVWRIAGRGCDRKGLRVPLMERFLHCILSSSKLHIYNN